MNTPILLPKLGFSMEEGTIAEWLIPDGGTVTAGQPLYSLESEKSVQEIEAPVTGTLRILEAAGGTFKVGSVIGEIT
jgi:pyruvate/2-oxoglutarate dehydrogenase complex dihydrolipoamide acyltransferase (E2) component